MQDRERGVVWEETIIFLPSETKMVFLSATLSNAAQFAAWVAALHRQPCHVVYTDFRPTPLQHYAFAPGAKGLHLVRHPLHVLGRHHMADKCGKAAPRDAPMAIRGFSAFPNDESAATA